MATLAVTITVYLFSSPLISLMLGAIVTLTVGKVVFFLWQQLPIT